MSGGTLRGAAMRGAPLAIALVLAVARVAAAQPDEQRVVLADTDPELRRAVEALLRPWHFVVVLDDAALDDVPAAQARATRDGARFVVWRDGGELVVFDEQSGVAEHRPARTGAFDASAAAAAAMTVKTMMRLPPVSELADDPAPAPAPIAAAPIGARPALRFELGAGSRSDAFATGARFTAAALIRPWRRWWWFGAMGDVGLGDAVEQASFKGTWQTWSALAATRFAIELGPWAVEPWVAVGLERSRLVGTEQGATPYDQYDTLLALRGGVIGRYRYRRWSLAAVVGVRGLPMAPAYVKSATEAQIFAVPPVSVDAGLVLGADVGL